MYVMLRLVTIIIVVIVKCELLKNWFVILSVYMELCELMLLWLCQLCLCINNWEFETWGRMNTSNVIAPLRLLLSCHCSNLCQNLYVCNLF